MSGDSACLHCYMRCSSVRPFSRCLRDVKTPVLQVCAANRCVGNPHLKAYEVTSDSVSPLEGSLRTRPWRQLPSSPILVGNSSEAQRSVLSSFGQVQRQVPGPTQVRPPAVRHKPSCDGSQKHALEPKIPTKRRVCCKTLSASFSSQAAVACSVQKTRCRRCLPVPSLHASPSRRAQSQQPAATGAGL